MPVVPESTGKDFQHPPAGTHTGRCFKLIDLGTQQGEYQGVPTYPKRQIFLQWELPDELMEDGKPLTQGCFVSLTFGEKATLPKIVRASGKEPVKHFNANELVGTSCNLNITHEVKPDGKVKVKIAGWSPLKRSETPPVGINEPFIFDLDKFNQAAFDGLGDFFKEAIKKSPEYMEIANPNNGASAYAKATGTTAPVDFDDEVPF